MRVRLIRLPAPIQPWYFWLWDSEPGPRFRNGAHTLCVTLGRWMLAFGGRITVR